MKRKIIELLRQGRSPSEISSCLNVSKQYIYKISNKYKFENSRKRKRKMIIELILEGKSNLEISKLLNISRSTVYRTRRKLKKTKKLTKLTDWSIKKFKEIKNISTKYSKKLSLQGVNICPSDIEPILLDLLIHTDQKNISNKDAYFHKYAPLKVSNLKDKVLRHSYTQLTDEDGEELYSSSISHETILFIKERLGKSIFR